MHRRAWLTLLPCPVALGCPAGGPGAAGIAGDPARPCAATLLAGGTIHIGFRPDDRPVEALGLAADGTVVAAGREQDVRAVACPDARVFDLAGACALPGLVDAHGHIASLGRDRRQVDLRGTADAEEAARRAAERAATLPPGAWLFGRGWDQNGWPGAAFPDRETLDAVLGDRPAMLTRVDGHAVWLDSAALAAAGIDAGTPDPVGGAILRRPDGTPTGVLLDNAIDRITARLPPPDPATRREDLRRALEHLADRGLTAVHDMGLTAEDLLELEALSREGRLPLRVVAYLDGTRPLPADRHAGPLGPRLRLAGVKGFADGALGSRGALLLEDYADQPGHRGLEVTSVPGLVELGRQAAARGLALAVHAIGDAGVRNALDAFERLEAEGLRTGVPRIEHVQVVAPADLPRLAALGIVASMQPVHAVSDMPWAEARVGPDRIRLAYAWRALAESGATLAFGTDFPVEEPDPFATLRAAATRRNAEGEPAEGWYPGQCLDVRAALRAMTEGAALASGSPAASGRLEPGRPGDVTVLDRDPLAVPLDELDDLRPRFTMVDGVVREPRREVP